MEFFTEDGTLIPAPKPPHNLDARPTNANSGLKLGEWKADVDVPSDVSLENSVTRFEGEKKEKFLTFVRGMLQWRPEDRKTAAQLLKDPWLRS
jgi:hypothetical protein